MGYTQSNAGLVVACMSMNFMVIVILASYSQKLQLIWCVLCNTKHKRQKESVWCNRKCWCAGATGDSSSRGGAQGQQQQGTHRVGGANEGEADLAATAAGLYYPTAVSRACSTMFRGSGLLVYARSLLGRMTDCPVLQSIACIPRRQQ